MSEQIEQVDSFVFYRSILEAAQCLPDDAATLRFLNMIFAYGFDGTLPEPERTPEYACFLASYRPIDRAKQRRKASIENGRKGGRPKGQHEEPEPDQDYSVSDMARDAAFWPQHIPKYGET